MPLAEMMDLLVEEVEGCCITPVSSATPDALYRLAEQDRVGLVIVVVLFGIVLEV